MNLHVPQSISTAVELRLITDAAKRFVSPATSRIVINAKQDTLMGSYVLTLDATKIDWKDAQNILMTTSTKLNNDIPKNKLVSGKFLYSKIIPKEINIERKRDTGEYQMRIRNGLITDGTFGKQEIAAIIQKTWYRYGSKETRNLIDDLQRMMLQFLMRYGYTVGIGDMIVQKKVHRSVYKIIETKRKEILTAITEYENDPYILTQDAFETIVRQSLKAIQNDIQKTIMLNFNILSGLYIAISSGSSGTDMNAGQIIGCIGQVIVESKRIQKKFNNRTLPMFHQHDDSAFARGFCANSFLTGLNPAEFFFQVMAGREGLINTAIKTADTGYIQRKLIKILEDIKVEYDGTVRNANDKIIQYTYGDNGINTEKQIDQKIELMAANNETVRSRYTYTKEEIAELKKNGMTEKYTTELNEALYRKLISLRDYMRRIQKSINTSAIAFKESYMMPIDIQQFIRNIRNRDGRTTDSIADPHLILIRIKEMYSSANYRVLKYGPKSVIKKDDDERIKLLLKFYLYDCLSPKRCTNEYKLSESELDEIITYFNQSILLAKVEGGEMVGFVGAHSVGEPVTQANLKSFHKSGTGKTVSGGLVRIKELLSVSKVIKTPIVTVILDDNYKENKVIASKIASHLKYTTLKDVVDKVDIIYDPDPSSKHSFVSKDGVSNVFEGGHGKTGCQTDINNLPWILRLTLSKEKMIDKNVTMLEIKTSFCHNWAMRHEDSKGSKKEYKKVIDKITQTAIVTNFDNSPSPMVHVRFDANNYNFNTLVQFQEMVVTKYKIKGIPNITESNDIVEESYIAFDSDGNKSNKKHFVIMTDGINLSDLAQINGINLSETYCNDIITIYETYGVEAARAAFIREFGLALESADTSCNYQHIELLADAVTHMGGLIAVNRHGANKLDTDPFSRASFEETVEQLLMAAAFGESDHIRSVSARIMVGTLINGGTGCFDLLLDHLKVKRTIRPTEQIIETAITKKKTAIDDLIKKKKAK